MCDANFLYVLLAICVGVGLLIVCTFNIIVTPFEVEPKE